MEKLGKKVRDKISGFEGVVIGKTVYVFGCNSYGVTPEAKDGKLNDTMWFDEGRIEIIGEGFTPASLQVDEPGGLDERAPNKLAR